MKNGTTYVASAAGKEKSATLERPPERNQSDNKIHIIALEVPVIFLHPDLKATFG
ncbi:MAG: hypothetical protein WCH99_02700 [Verrucomicrobiota bacterium]